MRLFVITAAIAAVLAGPALAQAAPAAAAAEQPAAGADKIRCKRYTVTGDLAKIRKECHTQAEWQRMAQDAQRDARDQISRGMAAGGTGH